MSFRKVLAALVLGAGCPGYALPCTCVGFGPACAEAVSPHVSAVFLGTVESIGMPSLWEIFTDRRELSATLRGEVEVTLSVQEAYKGVSSKKVAVRTNSSEAACGFPFQKGQQYVVYASEYKGKLYTSICQRTLPARLVAKDLAYLRKMKDLPETSEIFGTYKRYTYDPNFVPRFTPSIMDHYRPPEEEYRAMAPMTGETVTLTSQNGQELKTKVDPSGEFSFTALPPGKYSIKVTVPPKLAPARGYAAGVGFRLDSLEVLPKGCAEVTFRTEPDGHIGGRIVNSGGHPLTHVDNEDGTFDLGPLPPGEYILGAYVWSLPQGFPAMANDRERLQNATLRFFPGTREFKAAKPMVVGYGEHVTRVELRIPFDLAAWKDVKPSPGTEPR